MGMNRADAYYEPEDDDMDSDELQYEVNEFMKDEFNPCKWGPFNEAFSGVQDPEVIKQLEEMLENKDFEALGRKLWCLSYEYNEYYATRMVTEQY